MQPITRFSEVTVFDAHYGMGTVEFNRIHF